MELLIEIAKFLIYCSIIVLISKYVLVNSIRKLAESLKLSSKAVGNVAGYATSVPELLTISASSINGLLGASMYNVLSSNVINLIQYLATITINKNQNALFKNQVVKTDIILVLITILIPIVLIFTDIELNLWVVAAFLIAYIIFRYINNNVHKLYLENEANEEEKNNGEKSWAKSIKYIIFLILSGILLFWVGNLLSGTLENLCYRFNVPEVLIGILLGFITSIPELITFLEAQRHHKKMENDLSGVVEATNNLFTSNVLNLFIIQSIGVLIFTVFA